MMPEHGFPREIAAAAWLSWMIILGSYATWQDSTLLFQAIPALAMFGLIGCYDTYRNVTFAFYAFLLCLATLFARAHGRQMLRQSALSGYFTRDLAPGTPIPSVETTPGLALKLKQGPWRWVAGPQWALASAFVVVMISLLGAPVIRDSVSSVAGMVTLPPPPMKGPAAESQAATGQTQGSVRIGRGPRSEMAGLPVLEAKMDKKRYLREMTYSTYTGRGWTSGAPPFFGSTTEQAMPTDAALAEMKDTRGFSFEITLLRPMRVVALPPEVVVASIDQGGPIMQQDGTFYVGSTNPGESKVSGKSIETNPGTDGHPGPVPTISLNSPELAPLLDKANIPARVSKLAYDVSANGKNDYEKAEAIRKKISETILYNLHADAAPDNADPVEYALFEKKEAYCDIFASSMVLMARSIGIPARYVQGYLPDDRRIEPGGGYKCFDQDYHAWAELMFKDVGWVVFDPTIGADVKPGEGLGDLGDPRPWYRRGIALFLTNLLLLLASLALIAGCVKLYSKIQGKVGNPRTEVERAYLAFGKKLERKAGRRRMIGQTADEFLESVRPSLGSTYSAAQALNAQFVKMLYASDSVPSPVLEKARADLKEFAKMLKAEPKTPKVRPT